MSDEEDPNLIGVSNTRDGSKALGSYREMWNLIEKVVEERKCKSSNVTIETTEVRQLQRIVQVTTFKFFFLQQFINLDAVLWSSVIQLNIRQFIRKSILSSTIERKT